MRNSVTKCHTIAFVFICLFGIDGYGQLAKNKCRFLGNIISGYAPSDFPSYWNQVTPENGGKWGSVESTRDVMNWSALDLAYATAKANGFLFKQHTFVWGQQQPGWMATLSAAEQKEEVEEWIKAYSERYPDTDFIDVVNEPLHAPAAYMNALGGSGTTGWDWVIWTFEKARQYCPNAKLILNDYNIINNDAASDQFLAIINQLKQRNLIDGIGEQGHFFETTPPETLTSNLNKLHATGLPIYITEYDINLSNDAAQSAKLQEQFPLFWKHPGVQGITFWGYRQGEIWRTEAYLVRSDGTERPAMTWLKSYVPSQPGGSFCSPVTSIEEGSAPVEIFPNPSQNKRFQIRSLAHASQICVFDIFGRKIKELGTFQADVSNVELPDLDPGVYLLQISNRNGNVVRRIVLD
jgi:endo-1,4-beta-xylanase